MIEQGWLDVSAQDDGRQGGFQSTYIPDHRQLCHDDGPKAVSIATRESRTLQLVSVSLHSAAGIQSCSAQRDRSRYRYNRVGLHRELPVLSLPDGVRSHSQGSGGGGDEYDTHVTVVTEMSKAGLMAVLNDQIRDQGWIFDTSWSGSHSVGSTWAKESADGEPLIGLLTAYGGNEDAYNLRFEVRLDNAVAQSGGPPIGIRIR